MNRFFKLFFSRFFIVAIAIIAQFLVFFAMSFWLSESYTWVRIVFYALGVLLFFVIINKNKPASFKLPWVAIVLLLPVLGITLYLTFGNVNLSRKQRKKLENENKKLKEFCKQSDETMQCLRNENIEAYGQASYIKKTCFLPTYNNCSSEYLSTGEIFFERMIEELSKAKKYIFMEYFIIEEGKMWNTIHEILIEKVKAGVEVFFMYDDVGSISKVHNSYYFKLRNEGINACKFAPFKPIVSVAHNNRDHRKITVIDGEVGFIGGTNLADEYINAVHPFGIWKDNAVLLKGKCVDSLVHMFIQLYNPNSIRKIDIEDYLVIKHKIYDEKGYIAPYADGPVPVYDEYVGSQVYLNIINQAKRYLYITTPYLIVDFEFLKAICAASQRGVDVRIMLPHIADKRLINIMTKSNYEMLIKANVKIYEYKLGFIHAKTFIVDDEIATIGTINVDYRSLVHHFECGVWMYNTPSIKDIKNDCEELFSIYSIEIDEKKAKLNFIQRILKDLLRLFAPLM